MGHKDDWTIWWDTRWQNYEITDIVVQTDHPNYQHVDYMFRFPLNECTDENGNIDKWIEEWFDPFVNSVKTGQHSLHKVMLGLGYRKKP